jgi:hypothetical protein
MSCWANCPCWKQFASKGSIITSSSLNGLICCKKRSTTRTENQKHITSGENPISKVSNVRRQFMDSYLNVGFLDLETNVVLFHSELCAAKNYETKRHFTVTIHIACHWSQRSRVQTWPRIWIYKGDKNPQHSFLRMGSKAGCLMS